MKIREFIVSFSKFLDEKAFYKASPLIKSLLGALIVQWESYSDQPAKNLAKTFKPTIRLLNVVSRAKFLPQHLCHIVEIVPFLSSYETHIVLLLVWRNLKRKMCQTSKSDTIGKNQLPNNSSSSANEIKHLRFIFQKNITKLAPLYSKFFL
jgi:hypothetical protein